MTWIVLRFARGGRARYISHLDTARALQRTFARAGISLAMSAGMRPKPRISLGLPLPVGVEGRDEVAVAEVTGDVTHPGEFVERLREAAAEGLLPTAVELWPQRPRLDPVAARYECLTELDGTAAEAAVQAFGAAEEILVERVSPKGRRVVDLKRLVTVDGVRRAPEGWWVGFTVRHRADGAARPEEVVRWLLGGDAAPPPAARIVRLGVEYTGVPVRPGSRESE